MTASVGGDDGDDHCARDKEFAELYLRERVRLRRYAAVMGPHLDWEAAVHDAFMEAFRHWDKIHTSKTSWLRAAVYNRIVDQSRRCERPADINDEFIGLWKNTQRIQTQRLRDAEEWRELKETFAAIHTLSDQRRCALVLRFFGSSDDEIAQVLGVDRGTVRRYVSEALRYITDAVGNPERRLAARRQQQRRRRDSSAEVQRREEP